MYQMIVWRYSESVPLLSRSSSTSSIYFRIFVIIALVISIVLFVKLKPWNGTEKSDSTQLQARDSARSQTAPSIALQNYAKATFNPPITRTKNGILRGKFMTSRNGNRYEAYLGIRYGIIPSRFSSAIPSSAWNGTRDATKFGAFPPQPVFGGTQLEPDSNEDCLFLNVYTPKSDHKKSAVLVFIYGGANIEGFSNCYGADYLIDEEIILVTINYRLGILGFLNLQSTEAAGNMALKDQVLALKWVQENIEAFGGDPSKVTIGGQSSGGASVTALLVSPASKGLFRGAIAQSGCILDAWAYMESTLEKALLVGKHLNCSTDNAKDLVACLKQKSVAEIVGCQNLFVEWYRDPMDAFTPTLEITGESNPEPFLLKSPIDLLKAGNFNRVPLLLTINKEDGSMLHAASVVRNSTLLKSLNDNWNNVAPITFQYGQDSQLAGRNISEIPERIRKFYFDNKEITPEMEVNLTNLYTDSFFLHGSYQMARLVAKHSPVYTALITKKRYDFTDLWARNITDLLGKVTTHSEELPYVFSPGDPRNPGPAGIFSPEHIVKQPEDIEFSKGFVKLICSFVKTGIPEVTLGNAPKWSPVTNEEAETGRLNWLQLDLKPKVLVNPFEARMRFWDSIYMNT